MRRRQEEEERERQRLEELAKQATLPISDSKDKWVLGKRKLK